jgi:hypothetical protein
MNKERVINGMIMIVLVASVAVQIAVHSQHSNTRNDSAYGDGLIIYLSSTQIQPRFAY